MYDDQLLMSSVPGNSFVNTITIQGESGDSSLVRLEHANTATHIVFNVSDIKGLTLRDMTFDNNTNTNEVNSFFVIDCDSVEISHCKFEARGYGINSSYSRGNYLRIEDSRGCLIENNNFSYESSISIRAESSSKYTDVRILNNTNIRGRHALVYLSRNSSYLGGKVLFERNSMSDCYQTFYINCRDNGS